MRKNKHLFDLDPERLSTTDEKGHRILIHPEAVKGFWQRRRDMVYWLLISFYLVLPWINVKGKPAIQVNIFEREFTLLGGTINGVEPILIFLVIVSGLFFVAFMTSVFGRVWCGWACPQTVFIQTIFLKIEKLIEGTPKSQRDLDAAPWNSEKVMKRGLKWVIFLIISLHISHTFIGYVVGPRELLFITMNFPAQNWGLFLGTMILTAIILLDFGWFREQFCIIMCPYGRMQSVMMDDNSLVIAYDKKRGEPHFGSVPKGEEGDCVNCYLCVKVCPVGIDIRRGTQLECIHCTLCIDACDSIMDKIKKPKGLIKYSSENGEKHKILTPRSILYSGISLGLLGVLLFSLNASTNLNLIFLRSKIPFSMTQEGRVINHFQLKLMHQGNTHPKVEFRIKEPHLVSRIELITPSHPTLVDRSDKKIIFLIRFDESILTQGKVNATILVEDVELKTIISEKEVSLVGPVR